MNEEFMKKIPELQGKLQPMRAQIGPDRAHEIAMAAAEAAMRVPTYSPANIGLKFAQAYLQAYEAVEGWTKPQVPIDTMPESPKKTSFEMKIGNRVELINGINGHSLHVTLCRDGTWRYDAGMFGGNIPQRSA